MDDACRNAVTDAGRPIRFTLDPALSASLEDYRRRQHPTIPTTSNAVRQLLPILAVWVLMIAIPWAPYHPEGRLFLCWPRPRR